MQMLMAGLSQPEGKTTAELPLTTQELRKMNGEWVFCLEMNEEVKVVAYKKGFIRVTNDKESHHINGLTLAPGAHSQFGSGKNTQFEPEQRANPFENVFSKTAVFPPPAIAETDL